MYESYNQESDPTTPESPWSRQIRKITRGLLELYAARLVQDHRGRWNLLGFRHDEAGRSSARSPSPSRSG
jgi:hypothetical protein